MGVGPGPAVEVGVGPGVFVADGGRGPEGAIRLQPVSARPRMSPSSERRLLLMAVFILGRVEHVKHGGMSIV